MRRVFIVAALCAAWSLSVIEAQERQTRALDSPVRTPMQKAADRARAEGVVEEFILAVPGRASASVARFNAGDLIVRDAIGREWTYVRAKQYDTADRSYLGYYSAAADTWILWPADNMGPLQVGHATADGRVTFRPSVMTARPSAVPVVEPDRVVTERKVDPPPLPEGEAAAVPLREDPVRLPGAYYVEGTDGGVAYITRNPTTKALEYTSPEGTPGVVSWTPKGGAVVIEQNGKKLSGTATQQVLTFDKTRYVRIAILGVYFDAAERPHEVVISDGRVNVRTVDDAGEIVLEPLAVLSAVEVTSPARGRAKLRNGRLVWADSGDEWVGPIWLQGYWDHGGKQCEIEQDGRNLTLIDENGQMSKGEILNARTINAIDWTKPATINVRQTMINFEDGERWVRMAAEEFPVAPEETPRAAAPRAPGKAAPQP